MKNITNVDKKQGRKNGRLVRKMEGYNMACVFRWLGWKKKAYQLEECGNNLIFALSEDGDKTLISADYCKLRLCPQCAYRRSVKVFGQVSAVMDKMPTNYKYIFLTLTVKNCKGENLPETLDRMYNGWRSLLKTSEFKVFQGWFRALEVTYNREKREMHPHFHVILAVKTSYFSKGGYISQPRWTSLWKKACGLDYSPRVDVRKVVPGTDGEERAAIAEVAKYTLKMAQILQPDDLEAAVYPVKWLEPGLKGRRLVGFGGEMRELHKQLNLDDPIDGDLTDANEMRTDVEYVIKHYRWGIGGLADWVVVGKSEKRKIVGKADALGAIEYDETMTELIPRRNHVTS